MSSLKVVSCIMPLSAPPESYPKIFLDWSKDKRDSIQTRIFTDPLSNETFRIETIYIEDSGDSSNSALNNIEEDPTFVRLTGDSQAACGLNSTNQNIEQKVFQFGVPVQISKTDNDKSSNFKTSKTGIESKYSSYVKRKFQRMPKLKNERKIASKSPDLSKGNTPEGSLNQTARFLNCSSLTACNVNVDDDIEQLASKFFKQSLVGTRNVTADETKIKKDEFTTMNETTSLEDCSYSLEYGNLVIDVPEIMDSHSNSQEMKTSNISCEKKSRYIVEQERSPQSFNVNNNVSVSMVSCQASENNIENKPNVSIQRVPVEHPSYNFLQPLMKYFVNGECLICGLVPAEVDFNTVLHMEAHISKESSCYKCICCSEKFCNPRSLYMHALSREKTYKYMCDKCFLTFKRRHYLTRHNTKSH